MDRREHVRSRLLRMMASVRCLTGGGVYLCTTRDLSLGGMLLETADRPLPCPLDLVEIKLLGQGDEPLECEVVRVDGEKGTIAVRYLNLTARSRAVVQRIVGTAMGSDVYPSVPVACAARDAAGQVHRATTSAEERRRAQEHAAEPRAGASGEDKPSQCSGSDLVKALRTATSEHGGVRAAAASGPASPSPAPATAEDPKND